MHVLACTPQFEAHNYRHDTELQVDVVLGLHNSAGETFNITHIAGSINAPQAFHYYVQNFTLQVIAD